MTKKLDDTDSTPLPEKDYAFESKVYHLCCAKQIKKCTQDISDDYMKKTDFKDFINAIQTKIIVVGGACFLTIMTGVAIGAFFLNNIVRDVSDMKTQGQKIINLQQQSESGQSKPKQYAKSVEQYE